MVVKEHKLPVLTVSVAPVAQSAVFLLSLPCFLFRLTCWSNHRHQPTSSNHLDGGEGKEGTGNSPHTGKRRLCVGSNASLSFFLLRIRWRGGTGSPSCFGRGQPGSTTHRRPIILPCWDMQTHMKAKRGERLDCHL